MSSHLKHLVLEMSIGMFAYVLILGVFAAIFHNGLEHMGFALGPVLLGLFLGFAADVGMLVHMACVTEKAADSQDEVYANKTTMVQSVIRRVVFIAALFILGSRPQVDAVAMIIGALGLKAGAFLQPAVHRTIFGSGNKGRE